MKKIVIRCLICLLALSICAISGFAQSDSQRKQDDQILVLPFENLSKNSDFNWVGESIAQSMSELLNIESLNVVSNQERKILQERLGMSSNALLSLAAALKIAREGNATLLVRGTYDIKPETKDRATTVEIKARVINVAEGTYISETNEEGKTQNPQIELADALNNLQKIQGDLAFLVLNQRDKGLPFSRNEFVNLAIKVPYQAFEAYIKGLLASPEDLTTKANYFINALRIYGQEKEGEVYGDAALELGHLYFLQGDTTNALQYLAQIPQDSPLYPEAAFFSGLLYWQKEDYEQALNVLRPLEKELKLNVVYNALGAIATSAGIKEKDPAKATTFLNEAIEILDKTATSNSDDTDVKFNYGLALFLNKNYQEAIKVLRSVIEDDPNDGEAYYLLSKALAETNDEEAKRLDNLARQNLTDKNKYALLEKQWKDGKLDLMTPRLDEPSRREFVSTVLIKDRNLPSSAFKVDESSVMLEKANSLFEEGKDDEAIIIARRMLISEPMKAETYLLIGKIFQRKGDTEQSITNLKSAIFWNNKLVDAHVLLGRIYIQKRECQQAQTYLNSAKAVDPDNTATKSLERQVERCSN